MPPRKRRITEPHVYDQDHEYSSSEIALGVDEYAGCDEVAEAAQQATITSSTSTSSSSSSTSSSNSVTSSSSTSSSTASSSLASNKGKEKGRETGSKNWSAYQVRWICRKLIENKIMRGNKIYDLIASDFNVYFQLEGNNKKSGFQTMRVIRDTHQDVQKRVIDQIKKLNEHPPTGGFDPSEDARHRIRNMKPAQMNKYLKERYVFETADYLKTHSGVTTLDDDYETLVEEREALIYYTVKISESDVNQQPVTVFGEDNEGATIRRKKSLAPQQVAPSITSTFNSYDDSYGDFDISVDVSNEPRPSPSPSDSVLVSSSLPSSSSSSSSSSVPLSFSLASSHKKVDDEISIVQPPPIVVSSVSSTTTPTAKSKEPLTGASAKRQSATCLLQTITSSIEANERNREQEKKELA